MNVEAAHERVNESVTAVNAQLVTAAGDAGAEGVHVRPNWVRPLPAGDYGTPAECDRALGTLVQCIRHLERLSGDREIEALRDAALQDCRALRAVVNQHRAGFVADRVD